MAADIGKGGASATGAAAAAQLEALGGPAAAGIGNGADETAVALLKTTGDTAAVEVLGLSTRPGQACGGANALPRLKLPWTALAMVAAAAASALGRGGSNGCAIIGEQAGGAAEALDHAAVAHAQGLGGSVFIC